MTVETWLVHLGSQECEDLLAEALLGRLAVVVDGRPEIFPVGYVFDRRSGCVAFPTAPRTKLHAAMSWPWVAFEVDGSGPDEGAGWSVLVVGRAEQVTDPEELRRLERLRRTPWASGEGVRWVRIVPSKTSGRRVHAVER